MGASRIRSGRALHFVLRRDRYRLVGDAIIPSFILCIAARSTLESYAIAFPVTVIVAPSEETVWFSSTIASIVSGHFSMAICFNFAVIFASSIASGENGSV